MKDGISNTNKSGLNGKTERLYYLDWLRVITIIAVFFHHCSRIFDIRNSHAITGILPTIHREFDNLWMMPLFFMISGAAIYYSLKSRKVGEFIKERLLRILLPLIITGIFLIAPPLSYSMQFTNGKFNGSFFEWYPRYLKTWNPGYTGHLWFLIFLLVYTFILLIFFIPFGKQKASIFLRFSSLFKRSWGLLLLFIPLIAIAPLEIYSRRLLGGWDFLPYLLFIICGYLFFTNEQIKESIKRHCIISLAAAFLFTVIYLLIEFSSVIPEISSFMLTEYSNLSSLSPLSPPDLTWSLTGFFVLRHLAACCWMIAILGLAGRFLNFSNRFLAYASEAVLPFYILHMTIIYLIGLFVIQWTTGMIIKYIIIAFVSFIITVLIYEFPVRRINVLRLLFGMKIKK